MLKPATYRKITQVIPFGIIFYVSGLLYALIEKGILGESGHYPSNGLPYDFEVSFYFSFSMGLVGLLVGTIEVLFLKKLFINNSFGGKITLKTLIYIFLDYSTTVIFFPIGSSLDLQTNLFDPLIWERLLIFITSINYLSVVTYTALTLIISLFYTEISENIGLSVLTNFFTGKYHKPIEEERIFMFLDMKSSTTIAEQLGHIRYFEMLREYYSDLSNSIIQYRGEIYQYVGDEIVISWTLKNGLSNNNCIECFYAMKRNLANQVEKYIKKFDVVPSFKAGFHLGKVTTGEIGVIKKDIIFTGDVLNTTARIQSLCNEYNVDIILSEDLADQLNFDSSIQVKSLGRKELRGKRENVMLYTIK